MASWIPHPLTLTERRWRQKVDRAEITLAAAVYRSFLVRRSYFHSRAAVKTGTRTGRDAKIVAEYVSTFHYYFYRANQSVKAIVRAKCPQRLLLEQGSCLSSKSRKSFPCVRCQSSIMCGSCRTEPNPTITPSQRQDTAFHPRCDVLPLASATPPAVCPAPLFFQLFFPLPVILRFRQ